MTTIRRQIHHTVLIDNQQVPDVISSRLTFSTNDPVAKAEVTLRMYPKFAENNRPLEVRIGATPGTGPGEVRFKGVMRAPAFQSATGRRVVIQGLGELNKAAEFYNSEDPQHVGGLLPADLLGTVTAGDQLSYMRSGTAGQIIGAVLTKCGCHFNPGDIHDTQRLYPWTFYDNFVWNAGTPTDAMSIIVEAGESGLDYIRRYNRIEAEYQEDVNPVTHAVTNPRGGFYKIFESLAGQIVVIRLGSRPRNAVDSTNGVQHVFIEGVNLTDGHITRGYPIANTVLVKGIDQGGSPSLGPEFFMLQSSNPLMGNRRYSDPQPPNSNMIEHSVFAPMVNPDTGEPVPVQENDLPGIHNASDFLRAGAGMDCETVAKARMLEVNRVPVTGSVTTVEDWRLGVGQTALVVGTYNPLTGQSLPGRLATNEKVFIETLVIECSDQNGKPQLRQTVTVQGGGWPDDMPYPAPGSTAAPRRERVLR